MEINKILNQLNILQGRLEEIATEPLPSHIELSKVANQIGWLLRALRRELL
jgi:hypothetical protein